MSPVLLLSNSTIHGEKLLEWAKKEIINLLARYKVSEVLFIPYALFNYDEYTEKVKIPFETWGFKLSSIHQTIDEIKAIENAKAVFVGGGNTFKLLKCLYEKGLIPVLKKQVLENNLIYIGSSAGSNVAACNIATTNDMPIVYPPSFEAIGLIPFNLNPHYSNPNINNVSMGETRDERILQYHKLNGVPPVLALCNGAMLHVEGHSVTLLGIHPAKLFIPGKEAKEYHPNADLTFLLNSD